MAMPEDHHRRRHSDTAKLKEARASKEELKEFRNTAHANTLKNVRDLQKSMLQGEKAAKISDILNNTATSFASLYEEYDSVADRNFHKAVERHRMKRKEDVVSRHTTFFPKKLSEEEESYAKLNLDKNDMSESAYNMSKFPRGIMSLINQDLFYKSLNCDRRLGTDFDADELTLLFLNLGFIVQRYDNYTKKEIKLVLAKDAKEDYANMSCAVCCVLSNGNGNEFFAIDKPLSIGKVAQIFNTESLTGLPKILVVNSARGADYIDPMETADSSKGEGKKEGEDEEEEEEAFCIPPNDDFLCAISTVPGFYSWRNNSRGSWFLQAIFSEFKKRAHDTELSRLFCSVNKKVSKMISRVAKKENDQQKQMSLFVSRFRYDLYIAPPYGPLLLKKISVKWITSK